jgi:hypothetical protein
MTPIRFVSHEFAFSFVSHEFALSGLSERNLTASRTLGVPRVRS